MIRSFRQLYEAIETLPTVGITAVNPREESVFSALETAEKRGWIIPTIIQNEDSAIAAAEAVSHVRDNSNQLLMKGNLPTAEVLKAVLDGKKGLRTPRQLSHVAMVESPEYDRLMLMTDGGVNPQQTPEIFRSIILNAVELSSYLSNDHPNVAVLSVVEKVSENLLETVVARQMAEEFSAAENFTIEGPIALDVCCSEKAARVKNIHSEITGKTDIFVGPNITTINFLVKALTLFGHAKTGGVIMGAAVPIILLSRSDSMQSKLNSIAMGIIAMKGIQKWT